MVVNLRDAFSKVHLSQQVYCGQKFSNQKPHHVPVMHDIC